MMLSDLVAYSRKYVWVSTALHREAEVVPASRLELLLASWEFLAKQLPERLCPICHNFFEENPQAQESPVPLVVHNNVLSRGTLC